MSKLEDLKKELEELKNQIDTNVLQGIISNLESTKSTADQALATASEASKKAEELLASANEAKTTYDQLATDTETVSKRAAESDQLLAQQLGIVNASELSANFSVQAERLDKSSHRWWIDTQIWVGALAAILIGVIIWEAIITNDFSKANSVGFIIKLAIATPFAFLAYSASKQHRIETNLRHQYNFKAAVASALEAYNQLLSRNLADDNPQGKVDHNKFLQERIAAIFREPTENFVLVEGDDGHESWILGFTGHAYSMLQKIISLVPKK